MSPEPNPNEEKIELSGLVRDVCSNLQKEHPTEQQIKFRKALLTLAIVRVPEMTITLVRRCYEAVTKRDTFLGEVNALQDALEERLSKHYRGIKQAISQSAK